MTQQEKFQRFKALHEPGAAFVMPNVWDGGSTRVLADLGFQALATTSAGYGFSVGKRDSLACLSRDEVLGNARLIVDSCDLPVSADLEDGFGAAAASCAETVQLALQVGLVGGAIEDATGDPANPIYPFDVAVERIRAAAEAAAGKPFLLTARSENFLWGRPDLDDTIARLQAFAAAGADVLYAPGLPDLAAIRTVCRADDKPVNVVMGLTGKAYSVAELASAGVARISTGGSLARYALGMLRRAAQDILETGRFSYADQAIADAELTPLMAAQQRPDRC